MPEQIDYELQKRRVEEHMDRWRVFLRIQAWSIVYEWHRDATGVGDAPLAEGWTPIFKIKTSWPYLQAKIDVNLTGVWMIEDSELDKHCAHELLHINLSGLRGIVKPDDEWWRIEERTVEELSRAFTDLVWNWCKGHKKEGKKHGKAKRKSKRAKADDSHPEGTAGIIADGTPLT